MSSPSAASDSWPMTALRGISIEPKHIYRAPIQPRVRDMHTRVAFYTWWWFERGGAVVRCFDSEHQIGPGQWILHPPQGQKHHCIELDSVLMSIHFRATWPSGMPLMAMTRPIVGRGKPSLYRLARQVCQAAGTDFGARRDRPPTKPALDILSLCLLRGRLCLLVKHLFELAVAQDPGVCRLTAPGSGDPRLDRVLEHMQQNLQAGPLPLETWTGQVGLSQSQLNRLCQRLLGMSLRARRDQMLMDELRQRLVLGGQSIKELARELGFVDTAHLCRWTRQHTGRSPMQLRQSPVA